MGKYVYKVNANGIICADLQSAIRVAMKTVIGFYTYNDERYSKPIVAKVKGGYQITVVRYSDGSINKARIDVFEPAVINGKEYAVDETHEHYTQGYAYTLLQEIRENNANKKLADKAKQIESNVNDEDNEDEIEDDKAYCENCGCEISMYEYEENGGLCDDCYAEENEEDDEDDEDDYESPCDGCEFYDKKNDKCKR